MALDGTVDLLTRAALDQLAQLHSAASPARVETDGNSIASCSSWIMRALVLLLGAQRQVGMCPGSGGLGEHPGRPHAPAGLL